MHSHSLYHTTLKHNPAFLLLKILFLGMAGSLLAYSLKSPSMFDSQLNVKYVQLNVKYSAIGLITFWLIVKYA